MTAEQQPPPPTHKILIINPNTTTAMTDALKPLVKCLNYGPQTTYTYFTAPTGVPSINNEHDAAISTEASLPHLLPLLDHHDAFLVCCYSPHPLVPALRAALQNLQDPKGKHKPVAGIFETSVSTSLNLLNTEAKFGIVSTGSQWSPILTSAVTALLGAEASTRYAGTETTGLNADELHSTPREEVDRRMKAATKRLLGKGAEAICLGCAGMAGMEATVREACVEELGEERGRGVRVVDGVVSGVAFLEGALRAGL